MNFTIKNKATQERVKFTLNELDGEGGVFPGSPRQEETGQMLMIILTNPDRESRWGLLGNFQLVNSDDSTLTIPGPGDKLTLVVAKPMLSNGISSSSRLLLRQ